MSGLHFVRHSEPSFTYYYLHNLLFYGLSPQCFITHFNLHVALNLSESDKICHLSPIQSNTFIINISIKYSLFPHCDNVKHLNQSSAILLSFVFTDKMSCVPELILTNLLVDLRQDQGFQC